MVYSDSQKSDVKIIHTVRVSLQTSSEKLVILTCPFERAAASMVTDNAHVNNVVKNANGIRETLKNIMYDNGKGSYIIGCRKSAEKKINTN